MKSLIKTPAFVYSLPDSRTLNVIAFPGVGWGYAIWEQDGRGSDGFVIYKCIGAGSQQNWSADEATQAGLKWLGLGPEGLVE